MHADEILKGESQRTESQKVPTPNFHKVCVRVMSTLLRRDTHGDPWTPSQQKESELATPDSTAVLKLFDLLQSIQLGGPC